MKKLLRNLLIHLAALWVATLAIPGFTYSGGIRTLIIGAVGLMLINIAIVPLLKIMFLPLNLLTLGLFTWVVNVVGIYFLTAIVPQFKMVPYNFNELNLGGFTIPSQELNILQVAIITSFLVGFTSHFLKWLSK